MDGGARAMVAERLLRPVDDKTQGGEIPSKTFDIREECGILVAWLGWAVSKIEESLRLGASRMP
jgi:hypothetical protein